ncbi:MAG: sulfotransferase family 2 domain-containing protein [Cyanobacteria bacterium P01_F01_bin.150]
MTSNIFIKASNRISHMVDSSPLGQRWKHFSARFSDAAEAFRFTYERGKIPSLVPEGEKDWNAIDKEADTDAEGISQPLAPMQYASFSDGIPFTAESFTAWKNLKPHERVHRNAKQLQASVVPWGELRKTPMPLLASQPGLKLYYVVFMHIPKAGGTTLQHILAKNYLPNQLIHANAPEIVRNPAVLFNVRRKEPRPIITGHFDRAGLVYEFLHNRPIVHFTMFRDPIKRVLSHFNYLKTRQYHAKHDMVKSLTLEEYAVSSIRETCNKQALRILGYSSEEAMERSIREPEPFLEEAKQVLEQEFTLFGLTERYTEFLLMAREMLGWQDIVYQQQNRSSRDSSSKQFIESNAPSEEALQIIRDRNQLDIQLYEFACELFDQRCKIMGIDKAAVERYNQVSQNYQTVLADLNTIAAS